MNSQPTPSRRRFYPPRFSLRELRYQLNAFRRYSLRTMMILVTLFCVFCGGFLRWVTYHEQALDVSPEVANRVFARAWVPLFHIPEEAIHVNVYAYSQGGEADFQISEQDFVSWCARRGWKVQHQTAPPPGPPLDFDIGPNTTRDGYYYYSHNRAWHVMYDVDLKRAWVRWYSPR